MFVLAHVSDPHLAPVPIPTIAELASKRALGFLSWYLRRRMSLRREVLDELMRDLQSQSPDHIVVTGDLVNISLPREFTSAQKWLQRLGSARDVTVVPGNHDAYVQSAARAATSFWGEYMRSDDDAPFYGSAAAFPFMRRRGRVALIGLSSAVPTPLVMASGHLGAGQIERCSTALAQLGEQGCYRIVLIHHPPAGYRTIHKRLTDAEPFRRMLRERGAELILHGHDHIASLNWLEGPRGQIPVIGVPSGSAAAHSGRVPAAYNLYRIDAGEGEWACRVVSRGYRAGGSAIVELGQQTLSS
jgi:3',5'-cyclic AMP phosphodiesterase CpdA